MSKTMKVTKHMEEGISFDFYIKERLQINMPSLPPGMIHSEYEDKFKENKRT